MWSVTAVAPYTDCDAVRVVGRQALDGDAARTFLLPFDRAVAADTQPRIRCGGRRMFVRALCDRLLASAPFGGLRTALRAAIDLKPFQVEPALALLRHGRLRLLIADDVGLGKTIQAGLILAELSERHPGLRAIVVVPAGLRDQWCGELSSRFSLRTTIADTRWLVSMNRELPADVNPWLLPGIYLVSYDFVKQPEIFTSLEEVRWDLLVADEAHAAGPGTARLTAVQGLGARARRIVLLTATPPDSEPSALRPLTNLGRFDGEGQMTVFRRSRADAGYPGTRRTVLLPVRLTTAERLMHARLDAYAVRVWREAGARQHAAARLAAMVLQKRALSTATSLQISVQRRIALLTGGSQPSGEQWRLPLYDEDPLTDTIGDDVLGAPGLGDPNAERAVLISIADAAAEAAATESKVAALRRLLRRAAEPAIIFTEYRDTVAHLARAFRDMQPLTLDGSMTPGERTAVQRTFAERGGLLISTDAASEGLNLHHRCRMVVHFELPWMPTRLEQRAGRVDRFGQSRTVHEIMLVARHTCERRVLAPLVRRIRTSASAGAARHLSSLPESAVAAAVLGRTPVDVPETHPAPDLSTLPLRSEAEEECQRIATLRRIWTGVRNGSAWTGAGEIVVHASGIATGRVLIVARVSVEDSQGIVLHQGLVPLEMPLDPHRRPRRAVEVKALARALLEGFSTGAGSLVEELLDMRAVMRRIRAVLTGLAAREALLATGRGEAEQVQPGLFDRRAMQRAGHRARSRSILAEETSILVPDGRPVDLRTRFEIVAVRVGGSGLR
jgi:superfamily II DNA or RNA helicase